MSRDWYCRIKDSDWGPMSMEELVAVARCGLLARQDVVRQGTTGTWVRADTVQGLFGEELLRNLLLSAGKKDGNVDLSGNYFSDADFAAAVRELGPGSEIVHLWLGETQFGNEGLIALSDTAHKHGFLQLRTLDLSHTHVGDEGVLAFSRAAEKRALPQLDRLYLQFTKLSDIGLMAIAKAADNNAFPQLSRLVVGFTRVGDEGVAALAQAAERQGFRHLDLLALSNTHVGDEGLRAIAHAAENQAFLEVSDLSLDNTRITDTGVTALAESAKKGGFQQLKWLSLSNTEVSDVGMLALAESARQGGFRVLEGITVEGTKVGDTGAYAIVQAVKFGGFPSLHHLDIPDCAWTGKRESEWPGEWERLQRAKVKRELGVTDDLPSVPDWFYHAQPHVFEVPFEVTDEVFWEFIRELRSAPKVAYEP